MPCTAGWQPPTTLHTVDESISYNDDVRLLMFRLGYPQGGSNGAVYTLNMTRLRFNAMQDQGLIPIDMHYNLNVQPFTCPHFEFQRKIYGLRRLI